MSDTMSPEQRHRCMSHIRSRNTKPELKVRQWLWNHGYRYRLCVKGVPGKPDIVMRKYRTAIFVNGYFWHGHGVEFAMNNLQCTMGEDAVPASEMGYDEQKIKGGKCTIECRDAVETRCSTSLHQVQSQPSAINSPCCKIPQTHREFWVAKIRRNQERDQQNYQTLQDNGWQVIVVWECQLKTQKLEATMLQVEQRLLSNFLAALQPKRTHYDWPEETSLPIAAEPPAEYKA